MNITAKLSFDRIVEMVCENCSTGFARRRAGEETFSSSCEEVRHRLVLCDEMRQILMFETSFPDSGFPDCIHFLIPLSNENTHIDLPSLSILRSSLDTLRKTVNFFNGLKDGKYPALRAMTESIATFPEVLRRIDIIIDKYGEVRDGASIELRDIRRRIHDKEGSVSKKIQSVLSAAITDGYAEKEASVSIRDGKMLIPVAAGLKKKIPGIVYDESASGKTAFIEPIEVIEINNQLKELHFEEQREILRILVTFTEFLRPYLEEILRAEEYLSEMDFIRAKTQVSRSFEGGMPVISEQGELILRKGRHPLLETALKREGKEIVPLDLTLTPNKRILLISGPNAGGKSVCLKTVGLLQYMLQWGMLIPAGESSELRLFDRIFIDIGDNQSIDNDLSTYSSHLTNMRNLLSEATADSLVLIDEFGSGTEPAAGGAIAEEILAELEKRGCYGVITTHYTNLKFYANNSSGIQNGAMMFDAKKIEPMFRLEMGLPGNSFAFELARKIGLPESIVHGAEERAGSDYVTIERNLRKIARNKRSLEEKLSRIKNTDRTLESITEKYEKELADIKALRKSIIEEARQEAQEILAQANKKVENTIREIKESQAEKEKTKEARKQLNDFRTEMQEISRTKRDEEIERKMQQIIQRKERRKKRQEEREKNAAREKENGGQEFPAETKNTPPEEMCIISGTKVKIKDSQLVGEVLQVNGKKVKVVIGNITSQMDISRLEIISSKTFKDAVKPAPRKLAIDASITDRRLHFKPTLDIRGLHLEEAITTVTHYLDDAVMVGFPEVSILHGTGTGVLREEIRKYLRIYPEIKGFRDEAVERGGAGITIVTFK
ncbi:MAG: Smr/MutS family protein [Alistipes sp.]|nr:Smr/MutS family protein [Candidatus Minthomonas equi]